jgi:succinate dehydrogenase/fumarate reductase flavoprotein subunit
MTSQPTPHYHADVVIIGFGAAGGCATIEAHDAGANIVLLEKQPEATHYSKRGGCRGISAADVTVSHGDSAATPAAMRHSRGAEAG